MLIFYSFLCDEVFSKSPCKSVERSPLDIAAPFTDERLEIRRPYGVEIHLKARSWMHETKCLGMQGLPLAAFEAVLYESFVRGTSLPTEYLVATITLVAEKRVPYMFHMRPYLMRAPRLENALHKRNIPKAFKYTVMGHRGLANARSGVEDFHTLSLIHI